MCRWLAMRASRSHTKIKDTSKPNSWHSPSGVFLLKLSVSPKSPYKQFSAREMSKNVMRTNNISSKASVEAVVVPHGL